VPTGDDDRCQVACHRTRDAAWKHPSVTKLRDLHMLIGNVGGRERTEAEWRTVLVAGGFRLGSKIAAGPAYHVLEAVPD